MEVSSLCSKATVQITVTRRAISLKDEVIEIFAILSSHSIRLTIDNEHLISTRLRTDALAHSLYESLHHLSVLPKLLIGLERLSV